jgi:hypothetical protein
LRDPHLEDVAHWHPIEGTPEKKKVAIGCSVGAAIETYDFIGFGIAAALYFNTAFFPNTDPLSGTLLSFATLGIGFAVRPLAASSAATSATRSAASRSSSARCSSWVLRRCSSVRCPPTSRSASGPGSCW